MSEQIRPSLWAMTMLQTRGGRGSPGKKEGVSINSQSPGVSVLGKPEDSYKYENWIIKKAERQRSEAFRLWCWRRQDLESPLDSKEIKPVNPRGNQP